MPLVTQHPPGTFCWPELGTTDPAAAVEFYTRLLGWTAHANTMDAGVYHIFRLGERDAAAMYELSGPMRVQGAGAAWGSYVSVASADEVEALARFCQKRNILLISDEVYRTFSYDGPFASPAKYNDQVLVVDGFSKSYGMTGWRLGYAHGPSQLIQEMAKLQQFSYVCAPAPLQKGVVDAMNLDLTAQAAAYRAKRDQVVQALSGLYDLGHPGGAFYAFPKVPAGYASATEFAAAAIPHNLLIIPGNVFSKRDTHFRISYAVNDRTLERGLDVLKQLAAGPKKA